MTLTLRRGACYPAALNSLFHLAFNVTNLNQVRAFYGGVPGCREGRSTATTARSK